MSAPWLASGYNPLSLSSLIHLSFETLLILLQLFYLPRPPPLSHLPISTYFPLTPVLSLSLAFPSLSLSLSIRLSLPFTSAAVRSEKVLVNWPRYGYQLATPAGQLAGCGGWCHALYAPPNSGETDYRLCTGAVPVGKD